MAKLSPVFNDQTVDVNGNPAVGYQLFTYVAGSSTKATTYSDEAGAVPNTNPIIINSLGYPTQGAIRLTEGANYKFVLASPTDTDPPTSPVKTIDNVQGVNDASVSVSQWQASGVSPTYVSASSFTLIGDQTSEFHPYRRLQFTTSAGTVYGNITSSVFTTLTTVTVQMDAGMVLDSGLTVVNVSILRADRLAIPSGFNQSFAMIGTSVIGAKGVAVPAAATTAVFGATDGNVVDISGSGFTITSFGTSPQAGYVVEGTFTGSGTLTHSTNLNLGGGNITILPGDKYRAIANSTTQIDVIITPSLNSQKLQPIAATVASNALTFTLNPTALEFRSATLGSGVVNRRNVTTAVSLVVPSGATLGTTSAILGALVVLAIDNAGTVEIGVINAIGATNLDETGFISTAAISAASSSLNTVYTTTTRSGVPYRVIGYVESTQATAGTWATAPSKIQGFGGLAFCAPLRSITTAKAWVNFQGGSASPIAPRANFNIASITKLGTGDFVLNFTNPLTDINYAVLANAGNGNSITYGGSVAAAVYTTSTARINIATISPATLADSLYVNAVIFGN